MRACDHSLPREVCVLSRPPVHQVVQYDDVFEDIGLEDGGEEVPEEEPPQAEEGEKAQPSAPAQAGDESSSEDEPSPRGRGARRSISRSRSRERDRPAAARGQPPSQQQHSPPHRQQRGQPPRQQQRSPPPLRQRSPQPSWQRNEPARQRSEPARQRAPAPARNRTPPPPRQRTPPPQHRPLFNGDYLAPSGGATRTVTMAATGSRLLGRLEPPPSCEAARVTYNCPQCGKAMKPGLNMVELAHCRHLVHRCCPGDTYRRQGALDKCRLCKHR